MSEARYRLRALLYRDAVEQDLDDELRWHLERETEKLMEAGLDRDEAARRARIALGGIEGIKEDDRDVRGVAGIEAALADLRYAVRRLRAEPGFSAVAVLTLAVGIGGTTAIFSAVRPILFDPLPYPGSSRLAMIEEVGGRGTHGDGTFGMYLGLSERSRAFDRVAVYKGWQPTLTGAERAERFEGQRVSADYFTLLGVAPALGRGLQRADDVPNSAGVVVLSDALWRRRFGGGAAIIGSSITLDNTPYTVVGVMPKTFENILAPAADVWAPLQYDLTQGRAWGHHLKTIGRLRDGVSVEAAAQEVDAVAHAVVREQHPNTYPETFALRVVAMREAVTRGVKPALAAILGAMMLVLVIACVNVTNLLLARGVRRRSEFALRAALGARQRRLVRQMLTESLLLALVGGAAGAAVAGPGLRVLVALSPAELPRVGSIRLDGSVFAFGLVVTTLVGLALGLVPALHAARSNPQEALQGGSRRTTGGHRRARSTLVVAETSLAVVLLVSSGLLLRSLQRLFAVDAGFDDSRLLTMQVLAASQQYTDPLAAQRYYDQVLDNVRRVPGVTVAAFTSQLPLSGDRDEYGVHFAINPTETVEGGSTFRYAVSPGYIETMRIPLRRGRVFDAGDHVDAPHVALLSESYARRVLKGAEPLGQLLRIGPANGPPYTVVGVVGDVRQQSLALSVSDAVYVPVDQWAFGDRTMTLVVRARSDVEALTPAIREAVWAVDKDQPIVRVATMTQLLEASAVQRRFALMLFEAFALAALVLAASGIYGVLAGSVAERTREIGVRAALGATHGAIITMVVRQGLSLTFLGVALGLIGAAAASQALVDLLFGVSQLDPMTYGGVVLLLATVALAACCVPAWRAARVDPVTTLKADY